MDKTGDSYCDDGDSLTTEMLSKGHLVHALHEVILTGYFNSAHARLVAYRLRSTAVQRNENRRFPSWVCEDDARTLQRSH